MIEVKNLTKMFSNFKAVDDISFSVGKGEILGLLGPNGAGKTTTMRILTCFLPATSGSVSVAGYDTFEDSFEVRRRIGYLPENPPLYPEMTIRSYLNFIAEIRELPSSLRAARIDAVVQRTALGDHQKRVIGTLSKGYRQRVGLAQALLHEPDVLILDEPTVGLDPAQIIEIRNLIKEMAKDRTVVLSTHILPEVSMTCKRVIIINEGKVVATDTVERLETQGHATREYRMVMKPAGVDWKSHLTATAGVEVVNEEQVGELVRFNLRLPNEAAYEAVFKNAVAKGHLFTGITPAHASLEEIFLKLVHVEATPEERRSVQ